MSNCNKCNSVMVARIKKGKSSLYCKPCATESQRKYRMKNREVINLKKKGYYTTNKKSILNKSKKYRKDNKVMFNLWCAERRSSKLQRTPSWYDKDKVKAMYKISRSLSLVHGVQYHVDHIIPLQGKLVSGLHVQGNLQVILGSENISKHNNWEVV